MTIKCQTPLVANLDLRIALPPPKIVDPFYVTKAYRDWAMAVKRRARFQCEAPDCQTPRHGAGKRMFADHIVELRDGGAPLDLRNGQCLCYPCHTRKTYAAKRARRPADAR